MTLHLFEIPRTEIFALPCQNGEDGEVLPDWNYLAGKFGMGSLCGQKTYSCEASSQTLLKRLALTEVS